MVTKRGKRKERSLRMHGEKKIKNEKWRGWERMKEQKMKKSDLRRLKR